MKGVPRIVKSHPTMSRVMWIFVVLALLSVSINACYQLLTEYLAKPKTIKMSDINAFGTDYYEHSTLFALPEITVCNQNPLTAYNNYTGINWLQYVIIVSQQAQNFSDKAKGHAFSPRGYIEFLRPEALLHNECEHDFIIECSYETPLNPVKSPCAEKFIIRHFPNAFYSQCYTISLNNSSTYMNPTRLSLTLYLDEVNAPVVPVIGRGTMGTSGVAVMIHEKGHTPDVGNVMIAAPGALTNFKITNMMFKRLADEKDPCTDTRTYPQIIQDFTGQRFNYSQLGCWRQTTQNLVWASCSCIVSTNVLLPENATVNELCYCRQEYDIETQSISCVDNVYSDETIDEIAASCSVPCQEIVHSVSAFSSPWPSASMQLAFYDQYIKDKSNAEYFMEYTDIATEFQHAQDNKRTLQQLNSLSLIQQNFAKIDFSGRFLTLSKYSVEPLTSVTSLIASTGSMLNLWSGISVIIIVEVFDLIFRLVHKSIANRNTQSTKRTPVAQQNTQNTECTPVTAF